MDTGSHVQDLKTLNGCNETLGRRQADGNEAERRDDPGVSNGGHARFVDGCRICDLIHCNGRHLVNMAT